MPINAYTGLMGSGKSYEVVSSVIVPAIKAGRRVVTNIDGIDGPAIAAYCHEKFGVPLDKAGTVVHVTNEQVKQSDFLPYGEAVDTVAKPGDLVCIDEAWRVWGTSEKILKEHAIFFREHRHYADPATGVTCDLVVMVQDIADLHRQLKSVVELSFRTKKLKSFGLNKTYTIQMWEGWKQTAKAVVTTSTKKYNAEVFPLYSSYAGGSGKEVTVDNRQNVLANPRVWLLVLGVVLMFGLSVWFLVKVFSVEKAPGRAAAPVKEAAVVVPGSMPPMEPPGSRGASSAPAASVAPAVSASWRIAGRMASKAGAFVVLQSSDGRVRLGHPSEFVFLDGRPIAGVVDGQRVTDFGGTLPEARAASQTGGKL